MYKFIYDSFDKSTNLTVYTLITTSIAKQWIKILKCLYYLKINISILNNKYSIKGVGGVQAEV